MKKKSKSLLLMALLLSLMMSAFGCVITSDTEESLSESASESIIESEIESVITPDIEVEKIQAKNELATILDETSNVVVNVSGVENVTYYFSKDAEGALFGDAKGEDDKFASARGGAIYSLDLEGEYIGICPNEVHTNCCILCGMLDPISLMEGAIPLLEEGKYEFSIEKGTTRIDFVVDETSLLLDSFAIYATEEGLETHIQTYTFEYGADVTFDWIGHAYEELNAFETGEDLRVFELRIHPLTENEQIRNFTVKADVNVEMLFGYYFYKNVSCTQDIEDFADILESYNDFRVYATDYHVEISFDFLLTEADVDQFAAYIESYVTLAQTSSDYDEIEYARELMEDKMSYFVHQYHMGQIKYYKDISNAEGNAAFEFAVDTYNDAYVDYINAYKTLYELEDNAYSTWFFASWSEEDLAILKKDNETISELEKRISEIEQEYNALKTSSATWSDDVAVLYEEFVSIYQQIATLNGYDNAYDYFCQEVYSRSYTAEERTALKAGIRDVVINYSAKAKTMSTNAQGSLSSSQKDELNTVLYTTITSKKNKYISGYMNSYSNGLEDKMMAIYDKKAGVYATSAKSQGTAYAQYSSYYGEAFTFFGKQYQDVLTFIHELGHYVSFSAYTFGSMPYDFAETHSQGNEWMFLSYLEGKVNPKVLKYLVYNNLNSALNVVVRGMLIDEFEYRVFTAETPYTAAEYRDVFIGVLEEFGLDASLVDAHYKNYAQRVIINSPCYYLNYVTSSLASLGFYTLAKTEGYEVAQEVYRKLQEDCDVSMSYAQIVKNIGLPSPFEAEAYEMLVEVFFPEEA